MEDALVLSKALISETKEDVLILVLMEDALVPKHYIMSQLISIVS